ncbi:hypothetical protein B0O99DRAFT_343888 [Bisporella sp. PMI_857]|nr:hypothetical protein B0O99DRAFT_343888 [Bisporella sp. PMI_857]
MTRGLYVAIHYISVRSSSTNIGQQNRPMETVIQLDCVYICHWCMQGRGGGDKWARKRSTQSLALLYLMLRNTKFATRMVDAPRVHVAIVCTLNLRSLDGSAIWVRPIFLLVHLESCPPMIRHLPA